MLMKIKIFGIRNITSCKRNKKQQYCKRTHQNFLTKNTSNQSKKPNINSLKAKLFRKIC